MLFRPIAPADRAEVAELIYCSINTWYARRGCPEIFRGGPGVTDIFYETYNDLSPGCNVVAENPQTGRIMGSCFYHPRQRHVSLGIMNVHPNYFGRGVGSALLRHIIDFTEKHGYAALRLTSSAMNVDSFSLYNKAGFVPRTSYQDMLLEVPDAGLRPSLAETSRVRDATLADVPRMAELELEVAGISRSIDYAYAIENKRGYWHASVLDKADGTLAGFMISCSHSAMNMIGPGVAQTERAALALLEREVDLLRGRTPVCLIPTDKQQMVRHMYALGAKNCELHFCQVRGEFQPYAGVNVPSFLPETA
jgi:GNAT superfamily N-acetyltransferase